jgi:hypothetical protein
MVGRDTDVAEEHRKYCPTSCSSVARTCRTSASLAHTASMLRW